MQIKTTYRQIIRLAAPLMLGSAGQNLMVACESAFLSWKSEADFAAIGYVGMFYLVIMAIAFGMSRGGQVLIARRVGEGNLEAVGKTFYALLYLELFMAIVVFLFMYFFAPLFFSFIKEPIIYDKTIEFLKYRAFGVFFSYAGLAIVAFYSGIARPKFIFYDTLILGVANVDQFGGDKLQRLSLSRCGYQVDHHRYWRRSQSLKSESVVLDAHRWCGTLTNGHLNLFSSGSQSIRK